MTRTERAVHPRALAKDRCVYGSCGRPKKLLLVLTWGSDRSESRSGYDKSVKKGGVGGWGSLHDDIVDGQVSERDKEKRHR